MRLHVPSGRSSVVLSTGEQAPIDSDFTVDVSTSEAPALLAQGFTYVGDDKIGSLQAAYRPTAGVCAGMMFFDEAHGRPYWRNAGNTRFVDALGRTLADLRFDLKANTARLTLI